MKKIIAAFFSAVLVMLIPLYVSATSYSDVDIDYSGVLGSYYETTDGSSSDSKTSRISITSDISYDTSEKLFYYYVSDIAKPFSSDVMDGMITNSAVSINVPEGIECELYLDGVLNDADLSQITATGNYVLKIKSNSGVEIQVLTFTIVGKITGTVSVYNMPDGFAVNSVQLNSEPLAHSDTSVSLKEEGKYDITYRCTATGVVYSLNVETDHTAPELKLEAVKDGKAWGPVDISDVEAGGSVSVYRNGEAEEYTRQLTKSGQYELVVRDAAGNKTDYSFVIMVYFNSGSFFFFAAIILIVVAVCVYIVISRKKLRVR